MAWVETHSPSFTARHDSRHGDAATAVLTDLEHLRTRLDAVVDQTPSDVAVILHGRPWALLLAAPWLGLARQRAAPSARRYYAGWFASGEIHVLDPDALEQRASGAPGSGEALRRSPRHEYAHLVIAALNPSLPPPMSPRRLRRYTRLAWVCEGAATYLAGQVAHLDAAIVRRLREGGRPRFPPAADDAFLLGGTLFAALETERGASACIELIRAAGSIDQRSLIEHCFARPFADVERAWREDLLELSSR